jgi:HSP20 family molecular chaperone IbpA
MKTMQVELFIQAEKNSWQDNFEIKVNRYNHETDNSTVYVTLDKVIVNIEVPEIDENTLTLAHIEQIQGQIKAEKAAHYLRVTSMEDQINSMMCLENKVED